MKKELIPGVLITLFIALLAKLITGFPFFNLFGSLVMAIIIGIAWNTFIPLSDSDKYSPGITFTAKRLLRVGIVFLGASLNLNDIYGAGWKPFLLAFLSVVIGIAGVYWVSKLLSLDKTLSFLLACGTGICGAAAIVAVSSQVKAKPEETATSISIISLVGLVFTLIYVFIQTNLNIDDNLYGIFVGSTLHEMANVVAAADVSEAAPEMAVVVKLTRVLLLSLVILAIGLYFKYRSKNEDEVIGKGNMPFPWFVLGFIFLSLLNTFGFISPNISEIVVYSAYILMGMAMAGIGLNIKFSTFKEIGLRPVGSTFLGTLILIAFSFTFLLISYYI